MTGSSHIVPQATINLTPVRPEPPSTSAMHRFWAIPELISMVAAQCDLRRSRFSLARVSRLCFHAAIPFLWTTLDQRRLEHLFDILFVVEKSVERYQILPDSVDRFRKYAVYVRRLTLIRVDEEPFEDLENRIILASSLFVDIEAAWFPNLRRLNIIVPFTPESFLCYLPLMVPSLEELHILLCQPDLTGVGHTWFLAVEAYLRRLKTNSTRLRKLELHGFARQLTPECQCSVAELMPGEPLQELRLSPLFFGEAVADHVSKITTLRVLILEEEGEQLEELDIQKFVAIVPRNFTSLREPRVQGRPQSVLDMLQSIQAPLRSLDVTMDGRHHVEPEIMRTYHYRLVAAVASNRFDQLEDFTVIAKRTDNDDRLKLEHFKQLRSCRRMRTFDLISFEGALDLDDDTLMALGQGWPSLSLLRPLDRTDDDTLGTQHLSWQGLLSLRINCPDLEHLTLVSLDIAKPFPDPSDLPPAVPWLNLTLYAPPTVDDPQSVAEFLNKLWSELHLELRGKWYDGWAEVQHIMEAIQSTRANEEMELDDDSDAEM